MRATLRSMNALTSTARWPWLCGALAPLVGAAFVISTALLTTNYSHVSETISQLGAQGRTHSEVLNTGLIVFGLLMTGFAYGLYRELGRNAAARLIWLSLSVYGAGILTSALFQGDSRTLGGPVTLEGNLHIALVMVAFLGLEVGTITFAAVVYSLPRWHRFAQVSVAIAVVNLVLALAFLLEASDPFEGLLERAFYTISLLWVEVISLRALRQGRRPSSPSTRRRLT